MEYNTEASNLVPMKEFGWTDDYSYMRILTCKNHTDAVYSTKNPYSRTVHMVKAPKVPDAERLESGECNCAWEDMRVIVDASQPRNVTTDDGYGWR